jgi:hypothetical protein
MKKLIALLLIVIMCLSLVACGNNAEKDSVSNKESVSSSDETGNTQADNQKAEAEQAIIGTWKREDSSQYRRHILTFNEDNTGTFYNASLEKEGQITWKYDAELSCYIIASPSDVVGVGALFLKNDGQTSYLEMTNEKYYRQNNNE